MKNSAAEQFARRERPFCRPFSNFTLPVSVLAVGDAAGIARRALKRGNVETRLAQTVAEVRVLITGNTEEDGF